MILLSAVLVGYLCLNLFFTIQEERDEKEERKRID